MIWSKSSSPSNMIGTTPSLRGACPSSLISPLSKEPVVEFSNCSELGGEPKGVSAK